MKRLVSIGTSMLITLTSLLGFPTKAYALKVIHEEEIAYCKPKTWTPYMAKVYALSYMKTLYPMWGRGEWKALVKLWTAESHWNMLADNPGSTAFGIAQVLNTGYKTTAPQQVARGLLYIEHRYGTPSKAWAWHRKHNWY